MAKPKISITKAYPIPGGKFRYYAPNYNPQYHKNKPKYPVFDLDPRPSSYPHITVNTERELIRFIYDQWGPGQYRIIAHLRGRKGCWTFWRGMIDDDGYQFMRKISKEDKNLEKLKTEYFMASDESEKQMIQDEMDLLKTLMKFTKLD